MKYGKDIETTKEERQGGGNHKKITMKERNEGEMDKIGKWRSSQIISPFQLERERREKKLYEMKQHVI